MCYSLYRGLNEEAEEEAKLSQAQQRKAYQQLVAEMLAKRAKKQDAGLPGARKDNPIQPNSDAL